VTAEQRRAAMIPVARWRSADGPGRQHVRSQLKLGGALSHLLIPHLAPAQFWYVSQDPGIGITDFGHAIVVDPNGAQDDLLAAHRLLEWWLIQPDRWAVSEDRLHRPTDPWVRRNLSLPHMASSDAMYIWAASGASSGEVDFLLRMTGSYPLVIALGSGALPDEDVTSKSVAELIVRTQGVLVDAFDQQGYVFAGRGGISPPETTG